MTGFNPVVNLAYFFNAFGISEILLSGLTFCPFNVDYISLMLVIRFSKRGKKHQPSYRIVVAEKRSKLMTEGVEDLGSYSPFTKKATINKEKANYWLKVGAKASPTVHNLFIKEGVITGKKVATHKRAKKETKTA